MHILHAYKACHTEIYGGVPEVIRILASAPRPDVTSTILAARFLRGRAVREKHGPLAIELVGSLGTLASTPLAPGYPLALARAARRADVVALHVPFPLNDIGIAFGLPKHVGLVVHWHADIVSSPLLAGAIARLVDRTLARADRIVVASDKLIDGAR